MASRTEKKRNLTIGRVAKAANVNIETVRHYQRQNLIKEPLKPHGGFRVYPVATIDRIRFIKRTQQLGFSLKEIKQLLELGNHHCSEVQALAEEKSRVVQDQINGLAAIQLVLDDMISACKSGADTNRCAFMDILSQKDFLKK